MEVDYISDSPVNYLDSCRACMGKGDLKPVFFDFNGSFSPIVDIFVQVTGLSVTENDGLPRHLCTSCISLTQNASHFKQMCFESDQTFRNRLSCDGVPGKPLIKHEGDAPQIPSIGANKENIKHQETLEADGNLLQENPSPYRCGYCLVSFDVCSKLKEHVKSSHAQQLKGKKADSKTKYTCTMCPKHFRSEKSYSAHSKKCLVRHQKGVKVKLEVVSDSDSDTPLSVKVSGSGRPLDSVSAVKEDATSKDSYDNTSDIYFDNDNMEMAFNDVKMEVESEPTGRKQRKKYSCEECDLTLTKSLYNAHIKSVHSGKAKGAKRKADADFTTVDSADLNQSAEALQCTYCERRFYKEASLRLHIMKHEKELNICHKCETCGREFKRRAHLENHLLSHNGEKGFNCNVCSKTFPSQEALILHIADHKGMKKHKCPHCEKGFNMLSTLKDHIRTHTGEKPFLCSICGRGFSQSTNLKEHMRRHQGYKPFKCSFCSQTFVSKGELEAHLRKHSGAHPFVCDECGGGFTTSSSLVKHKRIHTGERPYKCDFCNMTFTALGTMKNHRRTHTGEKPYKCQYCDKAFVQKNDLVTHTRTHTGERPYVCTICGHAFRQSSALKTHSKIHGGGIDLLPGGLVTSRNNEEMMDVNRSSLEENTSLNAMTPKSENSNL